MSSVSTSIEKSSALKYISFSVAGTSGTSATNTTYSFSAKL